MNLSKHDLVFAGIRLLGLYYITRAIVGLAGLGFARRQNSSDATALVLISTGLLLALGGVLFLGAPSIEAWLVKKDAPGGAKPES